MATNFRYKAKDVQTTIRGLVFDTMRWIETEVRIPLTRVEESKLIVETRVGDAWQNISEAIARESSYFGHEVKVVAAHVEADATKAEASPTVQKIETFAEKIEDAAKKILHQVENDAEKIIDEGKTILEGKKEEVPVSAPQAAPEAAAQISPVSDTGVVAPPPPQA